MFVELSLWVGFLPALSHEYLPSELSLVAFPPAFLSWPLLRSVQLRSPPCFWQSSSHLDTWHMTRPFSSCHREAPNLLWLRICSSIWFGTGAHLENPLLSFDWRVLDIWGYPRSVYCLDTQASSLTWRHVFFARNGNKRCAGGPLGRESDFSSKPCHNNRTLSPSTVERPHRQDGHLQPPMAKALQGGLGIVPSWTARERCGYLADAQAVAVVVTGLVTGHGAMVIDVIGVGVVDMIFLLLRFLGWRTCFGYTGRRTRRYHDFVLTQISVTNMSAIFHLPITSWIDSVLINSSPDVIICARIKSRCAGNPYHGNKFLLFGWWPPWHIWSFWRSYHQGDLQSYRPQLSKGYAADMDISNHQWRQPWSPVWAQCCHGWYWKDVDIWRRPQWWQTQLDGFKIRTWCFLRKVNWAKCAVDWNMRHSCCP